MVAQKTKTEPKRRGRKPALDAAGVERVWWFYRNTSLKAAAIARREGVSDGVVRKVLDGTYFPRENPGVDIRPAKG